MVFYSFTRIQTLWGQVLQTTHSTLDLYFAHSSLSSMQVLVGTLHRHVGKRKERKRRMALIYWVVVTFPNVVIGPSYTFIIASFSENSRCQLSFYIQGKEGERKGMEKRKKKWRKKFGASLYFTCKESENIENNFSVAEDRASTRYEFSVLWSNVLPVFITHFDCKYIKRNLEMSKGQLTA